MQKLLFLSIILLMSFSSVSAFQKTELVKNIEKAIDDRVCTMSNSILSQFEYESCLFELDRKVQLFKSDYESNSKNKYVIEILSEVTTRLKPQQDIYTFSYNGLYANGDLDINSYKFNSVTWETQEYISWIFSTKGRDFALETTKYSWSIFNAYNFYEFKRIFWDDNIFLAHTWEMTWLNNFAKIDIDEKSIDFTFLNSDEYSHKILWEYNDILKVIYSTNISEEKIQLCDFYLNQCVTIFTNLSYSDNLTLQYQIKWGGFSLSNISIVWNTLTLPFYEKWNFDDNNIIKEFEYDLDKYLEFFE